MYNGEYNKFMKNNYRLNYKEAYDMIVDNFGSIWHHGFYPKENSWEGYWYYTILPSEETHEVTDEKPKEEIPTTKEELYHWRQKMISQQEQKEFEDRHNERRMQLVQDLFENESDKYPEVGDILLIKEYIGKYVPGDYFFVHSQDGQEVSDCSVVGLMARNAGFEETVISDDNIDEGLAQIVKDETVIGYLWDVHLANLGVEKYGR